MPLPIQLASVYAEHDRPASERLAILGFVLWIAAYIFSIQRGFADRAHSFPVVAVCTNLTWEFTMAVYCPFVLGGGCRKCPRTFCPRGIPAWQTWALRFWFVLDAVILWQVFVYGARYQSPPIQERFVAFVLVGLVLAFVGQVSFMYSKQDLAGTIMAWIGNLLMSILFVAFVFSRPDHVGLSYAAAWLKLLGSAAFALSMVLGRNIVQATPPEGRHPLDAAIILRPLHYFLFGSVLFFDIAYVAYLS